MLKLGFQDNKLSSSKSMMSSSKPLMVKCSLGGGIRDDSPDSVMVNHIHDISLYSSATASVDRCSFASDVHDHEYLVSELSKHLAGRNVDSQSGPYPDLSSNYRSKTRNKVKEHKGEEEVEEVGSDDSKGLESSRNSFSLALIECQQNRLINPEAVVQAGRRWRPRPASLDLNSSRVHNVIANSYSPRLGGMKKVAATSTRKSGIFTNPGTPNVVQKGWSSERVPLPGNGNNHRRNTGLLFNSGRSTLPSKWEDAEKWIFSPVTRASAPLPYRRPKSKSGPLGPPGKAYYSMYSQSPAMQMFDGENSPFSAGVLAASKSPGRGNSNVVSSISGGGAESFKTYAEPCIARSASVHGWTSELPVQSLPNGQDGNVDGSNWIELVEGECDGNQDVVTMVSCDVSRRDMATQMSPVWSTHSSSKGRHSFSSSPRALLPIVEVKTSNSLRLDIRDVQVDDRVTMTRWSKKSLGLEKAASILDWKKKAAEIRASAWEVSDATKCISKLKREEAKITAWENLQKAKAETAISKLEMKLEKKRSSSMDKILDKLRVAQKKAQDMRNSASSSTQTHHIARTSSRTISFRRPGQIGSLSGCFTCHAF